MNTNLQILINVLCELKNASINTTTETIGVTMQKYNMLFLGSKFNTIYAIELHNSLNTIFNFSIAKDELKSLIPDACNILNMNFEKMISINDIDKSNPAIDYEITLWE